MLSRSINAVVVDSPKTAFATNARDDPKIAAVLYD
jgi:hypothetical protein